MKPEQRHLATAHLWLYSAGCDPVSLDAAGIQLAESLAVLLGRVEREGRRTAAAHYLSITHSGEHDFGETTNEYDVGQLQELLAAATKGQN